MDHSAFRAEFPVLERRAYLNAGTDGPLPGRSARATERRLQTELENGRSGARHNLELDAIAEELRGRLAALINASPDEVALTHSTTDGINVVLAGLELGPDEEVLTSDEEHPGLLAPLAALHRRTGTGVRVAPFDRIAEAIGERTKLIAVSHVSWMRGAIAPFAELRERGVPLLVDGAQSVGAIPVDVRSLGCDFYAGSGQKWLCGPDGTGLLFVREQRIPDLGVPWPNYTTLADTRRPLALLPKTGARRFDGGAVCGPVLAGALASAGLLEEAGWSWLFDRAAGLAAALRELLGERFEVAPSDRTTLVSWRVDDPGATVERLAEQDVIVRSVPGRPWVRASVGAWNSEPDLDRLLACA